MQKTSLGRRAAQCAAAGTIFGVAAWAAYAAVTWIRYARTKRPSRPEDTDSLLDQFMPAYEVVDRHQVRIAAPSKTTFAAACRLDLQQSAAIRAIFKGREWMLGSEPETVPLPRPLLTWAKQLGWSLLAEIPGREVVMGAVTRPWEANVVFHPLPPEEFAAFHEPGYVKIAWTLRADPLGSNESVARTETRATTTDAVARSKFRRYWAFLSPGIVLIRKIALEMVKEEAEKRAAAQPTRALKSPAAYTAPPASSFHRP